MTWDSWLLSLQAHGICPKSTDKNSVMKESEDWSPLSIFFGAQLMIDGRCWSDFSDRWTWYGCRKSALRGKIGREDVMLGTPGVSRTRPGSLRTCCSDPPPHGEEFISGSDHLGPRIKTHYLHEGWKRKPTSQDRISNHRPLYQLRSSIICLRATNFSRNIPDTLNPKNFCGSFSWSKWRARLFPTEWLRVWSLQTIITTSTCISFGEMSPLLNPYIVQLDGAT